MPNGDWKEKGYWWTRTDMPPWLKHATAGLGLMPPISYPQLEQEEPPPSFYFPDLEGMPAEEREVIELLRQLFWLTSPQIKGEAAQTIKDGMGYEYVVVYEENTFPSNIILIPTQHEIRGVPEEIPALLHELRRYTGFTLPRLRIQLQEAQRGATEEENLRREAEGLEPIEAPAPAGGEEAAQQWFGKSWERLTPEEQGRVQYGLQKTAAAIPIGPRVPEAPAGTPEAGAALQQLWNYAQYHNRTLAGQPKPPIYNPDTGEMEEAGVYEAIPIEGIQSLITQHNEAMQIAARQTRAEAEAARYRFPAPPPRPSLVPDLSGVPGSAFQIMAGQPVWAGQLPSHERGLYERGAQIPGMELVQSGAPPWAAGPHAWEEQVWGGLSPATKAMFWQTGGRGRLGERTSLTPWFEAGAAPSAPSAPALTGFTWPGPGFAEPPAWAAGNIGALAGVNWTI